jgi:cell division protein FtsQ
MTKRKKIALVSSMTTIVVVILLFVVFSKKPVCNEVIIEYQKADSITYRINQEVIKAILFKEYKNIIGMPFNKIDLNRIESKIEEHPSVENAEVYKKISGVLGVRVLFRTPIVRIITSSDQQFYIDAYGFLMPLSDEGASRVVPANGNIVYKYPGVKINVVGNKDIPQQIKDIYEISKQITADQFLSAQTEQIFVNQKKEYELIPKVGDHVVLLGDINRLDKKLKYLKHFYLNVIQSKGWRTYTAINLKFDNQIVCTKNTIHINN